MKKTIAIAALVATVGLAAVTSVHAGWGQRGGGYGGNYMQGPGPQMQYQQIDPAVQEKLDTFFADTADIRKEIAIKRAERQALMRGDNPDPAAVSEIAGELFDLRAAMHEKAVEAGVTAYLGPRSGLRGGRNFGPGARGMGQGGGYMNQMQPGPDTMQPGPRGFGNRGRWQ